MRHILCVSILTILTLGLLGCSEVRDPETLTAPTAPGGVAMIVPCGQAVIVTLWAGQYHDAGTVTVTNDDDTLSVEIVAAPGWYLTESHVAVARTLEELPQTGSGNPKVGHFDFAAVHDPPASGYTYTISVADYGYQVGDALVLAVHAVVERVNEQGVPVQEETAWADGPPFPGNNWATYLHYTVQECVLPANCELTVTFPNGGESFCLGSSEWITWTHDGEACGESVRIELLLNGYACLLIAASAPNAGAYEWEGLLGCDPLESEGYAVRVTDLTSGASDESDAPFRLADCGGE
ncbi:MAG: hypothetical protein V1774_09030 [Candidatus Eisenbacteria bacterium]